ncbi:MAG: hypothetical protein F4029_09380 [Gammaproteobacteria bacterium]|nr:hypothetical protein [Gammaproteobacteria bacterium]MYF27273.1 hypothetical protein [Gammaproteobacteria bacterium]MYK46428.1 hypothetical protein [Gammaproteobacteria bacterium]
MRPIPGREAAPLPRTFQPLASKPSGSATVEFVFVVPFVLILLAAVWDLRQHIAFRTELAREMYAVAEAISDDRQGTSPLQSAVAAIEARFRDRSDSGLVRVVVVGRGTQRADGTACPDPGWCPPVVLAVWPATAADTAGTWEAVAGQNACSPLGISFPAVGTHFAAGHSVLPYEGDAPDGGTPPAENTWVSRNMSAGEWWVVVDTCIEPEPGMFFGRFRTVFQAMLDTSFVWHRRAVWRSIHERRDCDWC